MALSGWEVNPNLVLLRRVSESELLDMLPSAYIGVMMRAYSATLFKTPL
jgi:hypothetical protein